MGQINKTNEHGSSLLQNDKLVEVKPETMRQT